MKIQLWQFLPVFIQALIRVAIRLIVLAECAYQMPVTPAEFQMGVGL